LNLILKSIKKIKKKLIELLNKTRTNNNKNDTTTRAISTCYFPTTYENPRGFSILGFFLENLFLN
ncbi:hypothetical protein LVK10_14355, partial [Tenacibaculum maritimum]|uniref:hypothetical protein n=1 Tax=Tenacibaculum maritimum TaxID=107401 RepID=UPI001E45F313